MKKVVSVILCSCMAMTLFGCQTPQNIENDLGSNTSSENKSENDNQTNTQLKYSFDPEDTEIVMNTSLGRRTIYDKIDELEEKTKLAYYTNFDTESGIGLICEFKVTGESINRIIVPPEEYEEAGVNYYGYNHLLTEVEITNIYYKGDKVALKEGDKINLVESCYYVTEETFWLLKDYPMASKPADRKYPDLPEKEYTKYEKNTLISDLDYPVQKGKRYVFYGFYDSPEFTLIDDEFTDNNPFFYNNSPYIMKTTVESIFEIERESFNDCHERERSFNEKRENSKIYESLWNEAKEKHGKT